MWVNIVHPHLALLTLVICPAICQPSVNNSSRRHHIGSAHGVESGYVGCPTVTSGSQKLPASSNWLTSTPGNKKLIRHDLPFQWISSRPWHVASRSLPRRSTARKNLQFCSAVPGLWVVPGSLSGQGNRGFEEHLNQQKTHIPQVMDHTDHHERSNNKHCAALN